jgi:hypothetical protein
MGNFFNNGPKILKLIVRVRIYHILINDIVRLTSINLQKFFFKNPVFKSTNFFSRCLLIYDIYEL